MSKKQQLICGTLNKKRKWTSIDDLIVSSHLKPDLDFLVSIYDLIEMEKIEVITMNIRGKDNKLFRVKKK